MYVDLASTETPSTAELEGVQEGLPPSTALVAVEQRLENWVRSRLFPCLSLFHKLSMDLPKVNHTRRVQRPPFPFRR